MNKHLNITLPESTIALLEDVAQTGERSAFIDTAIRYYVKQVRQQTVRELLEEGAKARAKRDLEISDEWFNLEEELWTKTDKS